MQRSYKYTILAAWVIMLFAIAACGGDDEPERDDIQTADDPITITFDTQDDFEIGNYEDGSSLRIEDGQYVIYSPNVQGNRYLFGTAPDIALKDVMIEVDATPQMGEDDNWFGVMCRVDEQKQGYVFLLGADGFWAIAKSDGMDLEFLVQWHESEHINTGQASNHIQAYCVEDYLSLYINGEFVGDHTDSAFSAAGSVGLVAGGAKANEVTVAFDDLMIAPAYPKDAPPTATTSEE